MSGPPGATGKGLGWEVTEEGATVVQKGDLWDRGTAKETVLRADTHSLSLGALFTFEASNARLTLHERKQPAHTGFSPKSLLTPHKLPAVSGRESAHPPPQTLLQ